MAIEYSSVSISRALASKPKLWRSCRLTMAFCIFLAGAQTSILRDNFGIALICMSKPTGNSSCETSDAVMPTLPGLTHKKNCEFEWDPSTRGRILGAFLYGYTLTTMISGYLSSNYGAKTPMICAGIGVTVFHLLCPTAALAHTELLFASRLLQGMSAGLTVGPSFQLLSTWMTEDESSALASFGFSGFTFGTILTYLISGILCGTQINGVGGWPLIYYVPAFLSVLIVIFWYYYLYDSRQSHPNISSEEDFYLLQNVGIEDMPQFTPWASILTSMPIIAYTVCYIAFLWNSFTMMINIPMFMQSMLSIKPKESGYLYCIPFTCTFLLRLFNGKTYPWVKNFLKLSNTACRKLYFTFGTMSVILSLLSIILVQDVTKFHLVMVLILNLSIGDFAYSSGFFPTLLDLAPNYSGLLSGISTFIAFLFSCPTTLVNSIIVEKNTKEEWNMVLWIVIILYTFATTIYLIFGSASLQTWPQVTSEESSSLSSPSLIINQSLISSRSVSLRHPPLF